jgi:alkylation response protein AidB-like acyl-CoA dehydrogenase
VAPGAAERDRGAGFDRTLWAELARTDFFRLHMPARYGGSGGTLKHFAAALEGFTEGCDDFGFVVAVIAHVGLIQGALLKHGSAAQRQRWLPGMMDGSVIGSFAITEEHAGSDVFNISTTGVPRDGGGVVLTGHKWNITNAPVADLHTVFGRIPSLGKNRDITAFLIAGDSPAVSRTPPLQLMGNRGTPTGHLDIAGHVVQPEEVLGRPGGGVAILRDAFLLERVLAGLAIAAYMRPIIDECVEYVHQREAFGKPIAEYQYVQNRIVSMRTHYELVRTMALRAVDGVARGKNVTVESSIAKMLGANYLVECATDAIKLFGNHGYHTGRSFERKLREAVGTTIAGGTEEIQKNAIWKAVQGEYRERMEKRTASDGRPV